MSAAVLACFSLSRRTWPAKLCYACILRSWRPLWTSWIACGLSSTVLATVLDADDTTPSVLVSAVLCSSTAPTVVVATRVRRAAPTGDTENRRPTVRTSERPCSRIWKHSDVCSWSASDGFIRRFVEQSVECFQKQMQRFWAHGYVQKHAYAEGFNHSIHSDSSTLLIHSICPRLITNSVLKDPCLQPETLLTNGLVLLRKARGLLIHMPSQGRVHGSFALSSRSTLPFRTRSTKTS